VRVRARGGGSGHVAAHYERETATIAVSLRHAGALREFVVLHELAHHLESDSAAGPAPHGVEFCHRYLELVDGVIGPEAALLLRGCLADCGALPGRTAAG
jgi:putative metallohydrolase (TIGR04338 family)